MFMLVQYIFILIGISRTRRQLKFQSGIVFSDLLLGATSLYIIWVYYAIIENGYDINDEERNTKLSQRLVDSN